MKILKHISRGREDFSAWWWKWPRRAPHHLKDYWVTSAEGRVYDGDCTTSWPSEGVSYRSLIGGWIITPHPGNVLFTANYERADTLQGPPGTEYEQVNTVLSNRIQKRGVRDHK